MTPTFLELLWQYKPEEQYILIWTGQNKRSHWYQDVSKAAEFATATGASQDVYVGLALSNADLGPSRRCKSDEASGICGIGGDLDLWSEAHNKKRLPTTIPDALKILPAAMPPSAVVSTGNGVHPWWLLKEPLIFDTEEERKEAARLLLRWHRLLARNAGAHGWSYDKLADLARILRIPGTKNHKDPNNLKDVTVLSLTEVRYNLSDFEEFLDREGIVDTEAQEQAARDWAEKFSDKPLVIDLTKRISPDRLDAWMREDMRFRNTWNRQRHDLKDQSQSGYDLALACFGMDAGLSEQEIVTLIIHHRAQYSRPQRTRLDYFQRTIAKATKKTGGGSTAIATLEEALADAPETPAPAPPAPAPAASGTPALAVAAPAPEASVAPQAPPVAPAQPDPTQVPTELSPAEKDALCATVAKALKAPIARFVKIMGKEPTYHIVLTDQRVIAIPGFGKFTSRQFIYEAIGNATNKRIPKFKPALWEEVSDMMLKACYIEEPSDEEDFVRSAHLHLRNYLKETGFIQSIADERPQDQRKPIITEDGRIAVSSFDFQAYMAKTTCQKVTPREAGSMLVAVGGTKHRVTGRGYDQVRRVLPYPEFDPKEIRPEARHDAAE